MQPPPPKRRSSLTDPAFYPVVLISLLALGAMVSSHAWWTASRQNLSPPYVNAIPSDEAIAERNLHAWSMAAWLASIMALWVVHFRATRHRRQAEESLRRQKDFAEMLIEEAPAIVLVMDAEGRILRCNPYLQTVTGYSVNEILGVDAVRNFLPEAARGRTRERLKRLMGGGEALTNEIPMIVKDGSLRAIAWSSRAFRDEENRIACILAIGRDMTELKAAQKRALQAERLAAIGQMVTGLAHESGNALQRSQSCLEMLALEVHDRPAAMDLVNRIQLAQDRLHQLYEEVRQYAAPLVLRQEAADPLELVQQAWKDLESLWSGRVVELRLSPGQGPPCHVDLYAIERVFRNILENSLAACRDPVVLDVQYDEALLAGRPAVQVRLRDNGPGLDAEQRKNIFEPFYTTKTQGTGLGMAISKRIVEAHGGQIAVGEPSGPGAEIMVLLPRG